MQTDLFAKELILNAFPWMVVLILGMFFYMSWHRERRIDRNMRQKELEMQHVRAKEEAERREQERDAARYDRYVQEKKEDEDRIRSQSGGGSGGYIVLDLPDAQRGLFHDLLKGFEEYARLKGYGVSFSVDTTFHDRIAFKFTLTDPDVIVGNDRIRKDLREYLERVSQGDPLDDLPQVISIEEHEVLAATLRNRISFLQHSYNLAKNSVEFYEGLIRRANTQPFLLSPNIVVQTGGAYNAPSYSAVSSPQAVLGIENTSKSSIRIAVTYKERKEQIDRLTQVLEKLANEPSQCNLEVWGTKLCKQLRGCSMPLV